MSKFEQQVPYYEAFYNHRPSPSHIKRVEKHFGQMVKQFRSDLEYYHPKAENGEMKQAIIVGLTVLHRLGAKTPGMYTRTPDAVECRKAFKHADRFLSGNPLKLPPILDAEDAVDAAKQKVYADADKVRKQRETFEQRQSDTETSKKHFAKIREILGMSVVEE